MQSPTAPFLIHLTIQGMEQTISAGISQHLAEMDASIQKALKDVCTPEFVAGVIKKEAENVIAATLKAQVAAFYQYGEGAKAIKEVVNESLSFRVRNG